MDTSRQSIRIGFLAGDFPWHAPPPQIGKLLSAGVMARNLTQVLRLVGTVVPYIPPGADASESAHRKALTDFLRSIDVLWADVYPGRSAQALALRHELHLPCPVILNAQGAVPKALEAMLFPWQYLLRPEDSMVFTCQADHAIWRRLTDASRLREWVVPLPIDTNVFYPRPVSEQSAIRNRLEVPQEAPLLLYVGRLNIQKNLHTLLRLLASVRKEAPDTHLCLVGAEDDIVFGEFRIANTGYVAYLQELAVEYGLMEAIRFAGVLQGEELAQAYAAADVLVNAGFYHRENFGLSQAEAQACGTPVVCSHWGGFKDVLLPGETGLYMDTVLSKQGIRVDWRTGAHYVLTLLQNGELRTRMGQHATAYAHSRFSIPAIARLLSNLFVEAAIPQDDNGADTERCYQPSQFASDYEVHKRACGWYKGQYSNEPPAWYPRMFGGSSYALYELMMQSYATRLAAEWDWEACPADTIPYIASEVEWDSIRHMVRLRDPIWSPHLQLRLRTWEVMRKIDGVSSIHQISETLVNAGSVSCLNGVLVELWHLHVEGFVLFSSSARAREGS
ncbi:MAG TPA: glycosyltransferase family 4 protein [Chthonomonadaceae bacterium]|nr:glycosyltransferase family 4 protein [Chthonomonadaceae bacterium]